MDSIPGLLAGAAMKATALLVVAAIITACWRSASASTRHLVWTVAVVASLLLPVAAIAVAGLGGDRLVAGDA